MTCIVTCHTDNCGNNGIGIEVSDPMDTVICGACGQEITDKVDSSTETTQE